MKKILHLITSLDGGGTENFLYQVVSHSPPGYDHRVLYLKKDGVIGERIRTAGVPVQPTSFASTFLQTLRQEKPAILHTCLYTAHQLGRILGTLAGVPAIITSQRSIDIWQKRWQRWLDTYTLPYADAVIVNSAAAGQIIRTRRGRRDRPRIFEVSNGVDPAIFKPGDKRGARQRLGLPADTVIGGAIMRLHSEKGADFIPAFAAKLLPIHPDLHLAVAGVGPMRESIEAALAPGPYRGRVHFVGWQEDTPGFLSAMDFFWSLSREESFPQTLVEASMTGLPWFAPDTGGVPDLIANGAVGRAYPRLEIAAAAAAVSDALRELPKLTEQARGAVGLIQSRYSLDQMIRQIYDVFAAF